MGIVEERPGGFRPAKERPDVRVAAASVRPMGPRSRFEPLRLGGTCINCGGRIKPDDQGWHDPDINVVMCAQCWPAMVVPRMSERERGRPTDSNAPFELRDGFPSIGDERWRLGVVSEYLMAARLHRDLADRAVVLNDRRLPHRSTTVDHVVVASSGIWVVASVIAKGLIEYRPARDHPRSDAHLIVGGRDRTSMTEDLYERVIPVAELVPDPAVSLNAAIVFIDGNWGSPTRTLATRPLRHLGVWVLWPSALVAKIDAGGPLGPAAVRDLGSHLDRALPPR
jgi:hypothetical protein